MMSHSVRHLADNYAADSIMSYVIANSRRRGKRYVVIPIGIEGARIVHFGSSEHDNYTIHKDDARKLRYLQRHSNEDWEDLNSAGAWARYILWNYKTIPRSIRDMEDKFGIKIKLIAGDS